MTDEKEDIDSILLMWSGGIASTAALIKLLTDKTYTDYDIIVHHMHLRSIEDKAVAEAVACAKILQYLEDKKKYRKFYFSESNHEYSFVQPPRYKKTMADLDLVTFFASEMCLSNRNIKNVVFGVTKTDIDVGKDNFKAELEKAQRILKEVLSVEEATLDLSIDYPYIDYHIGAVFNSLPRPIKKMAFSCRKPDYVTKTQPVPCGKCVKCLIRKSVGIDR